MPELDLGVCSAPNYKLICIGCLRLPRETQEVIYREKTEHLRGQLFPWVTIFTIYKGKYTTEAGHLIENTHIIYTEIIYNPKRTKRNTTCITLYTFTHTHAHREIIANHLKNKYSIVIKFLVV